MFKFFERASEIIVPRFHVDNVGAREANVTIEYLSRGHDARYLTIGLPKATELYTSDQLQAMGMVGIYEIFEGTVCL